MRERLKHFVIEYLTRHLLKAPSGEDVLRVVGNRTVSQGKRKLSKEELAVLREEATALKDSLLWRYMKHELEWLASLRRGAHCTQPGDVTFGSAMFYNLDLMQKFLDRVERF